MFGLDSIHQDRNFVSRPPAPAAFAIIISFVLPGLASCSPPVARPGPTSPGSAPSPKATLIPIASATSREARTAPTGPLAIVPVTADGVGRYEFVELDIQCDLAAANPFDPEELEIRVLFTSPSGMKIEIGAFWYQDFEPIGHRPIGERGWRVRFTPPYEVFLHKLQVLLSSFLPALVHTNAIDFG
jgi:hypothetical protein